MTEMTSEPPVGASVWELGLWDHLTTHVESERGLLQEYSAVAHQTRSKAFAYLVELLVEDEMRHHRIFVELAKTLKSDAESAGRSDPAVPHLDFHREDRAAILEATERLIGQEQKDAHELERLQRELRDVKDTTLWSLLVDLMQRDTQKHLAILRFAKDRAAKGSL